MNVQKDGAAAQIIKRLVPLPPKHKRLPIFFPVKWTAMRYAGFEEDVVYIPYVLFHVFFFIGVIVLAAILLDVQLQTGLLLSPTDFAQDKLLLPVTFSKLASWPALAVTFLFYLRLRLPMNLKSEPARFVMKNALAHVGKGRWVMRSLAMILMGLFCLFFSHPVVIQVTKHYDMEDSLGFILFSQAFALIGFSVGGVVLLPGTLLFEKVVRFFPALQEEEK